MQAPSGASGAFLGPVIKPRMKGPRVHMCGGLSSQETAHCRAKYSDPTRVHGIMSHGNESGGYLLRNGSRAEKNPGLQAAMLQNELGYWGSRGSNEDLERIARPGMRLPLCW